MLGNHRRKHAKDNISEARVRPRLRPALFSARENRLSIRLNSKHSFVRRLLPRPDLIVRRQLEVRPGLSEAGWPVQKLMLLDRPPTLQDRLSPPDRAPLQRSVRGELLVQKLNVYEPAFKTRMIGLASAAPPLIQRSLWQFQGPSRHMYYEAATGPGE